MKRKIVGVVGILALMVPVGSVFGDDQPLERIKPETAGFSFTQLEQVALFLEQAG